MTKKGVTAAQSAIYFLDNAHQPRHQHQLDIGLPAVRILGLEGFFSLLWPLFCYTFSVSQ